MNDQPKDPTTPEQDPVEAQAFQFVDEAPFYRAQEEVTEPVEEAVEPVVETPLEDTVVEVPTAPTPKPKAKTAYTPIEIKLPIVEDYGSKEERRYPGSIVVPNHTRKELSKWFEKIIKEVVSKQPERLEMSDQKLENDGYLYWNMDEESSLLVTTVEAEMMTNVRESMRLLHGGLVEDETLKDPEGASNLPKASDRTDATPAVILGVSEDKSKTASSVVRRRLSLSIDRLVPLWSSGFRIELAGPGNLDLLNLETKMLLDKIDISTETYGYALSSYNIYMDRILIDFILNQVIRSTAGTTDPRTLRRSILLTDFDMLVLGMASTIFPDGYPMERAMFRNTPDGVSSTVRKRKLNVWRMKAVRSSHFTKEQKERISKINGVIPAEELREHRDGIRPDVERFVNVGNETYIKLHTPTLDEYLRIGLKFNTGMEEHAKEVLGSDMDANQRAIYLQRASEISRVMYLSHWVEGIYFKDDGESEMQPHVVRVKDVGATEEDIRNADKEIAAVLEDISVFPSKSDHLLEEIEKYMDKMRLTFAFVPREPNSTAEPGEHPHVITVNPAEIFFTLLRHKIQMAGG